MDTIFDAPLYIQVRQKILAQLRDGTLAGDKPLPSEMKFAEIFDVSQGTVRKAIDDLVAQNILFRHQGRGTFIRKHDETQSLFRFFNFETVSGQRATPQSTLLDQRTRRGNKDECARLNIATGSRLIELRRVRSLDGTACIFETIQLDHKSFAGLEKEPIPNTLYKLYSDRFDTHITRAEERLSAITSDDTVLHQQLGCDQHTPLLQIERVAFDLNNEPKEFRISICQCDVIRYKTVLG